MFLLVLFIIIGSNDRFCSNVFDLIKFFCKNKIIETADLLYLSHSLSDDLSRSILHTKIIRKVLKLLAFLCLLIVVVFVILFDCGFGEFRIKICCVRFVWQLWDEWRFYFFTFDRLPVYPLEPSMRLDLSHSIVSEPFLGIFMQELFQQVLDQRGKLELAVRYFGEVRGFADDGFEELHSVLVFEGRVASEHFMNEAAETPPINISAVSDFFYDLRR